MASKAAVSKNEKRRRLVALYKERRDELKSIIKNPKTDPESRERPSRASPKCPAIPARRGSATAAP